MWRFFLLEKHKVVFCGLLEKGDPTEKPKKVELFHDLFLQLPKKLWTDGPTALNAGGSMGDLAFA